MMILYTSRLDAKEIVQFTVVTKIQMRYAITDVEAVMQNKKNESKVILKRKVL